MKVIERLNLQHAEKLRYFLSKADTVPNERDRQKVVVQITQNLSSRVKNKHAFELPSLYIPDHSGKGVDGQRCAAQDAADRNWLVLHDAVAMGDAALVDSLVRDERLLPEEHADYKVHEGEGE